jgi:hypothetical protein
MQYAEYDVALTIPDAFPDATRLTLDSSFRPIPLITTATIYNVYTE